MGQHLSDAHHDIATLTFDLAGDGPSRRYGSSSSICTPRLKFVGLSLRRYDTLRSQHYVGLVTLTFAFDLETGVWCALLPVGWCRVDNLPTNFGVSRTFHSRLISQHLSDASRDLVTLILEVTALVADAGLRAPSVYQV